MRPSAGRAPRIGSTPSVTSMQTTSSGSARPGDRCRVVAPQPDVFERSRLLAVGRIEKRRRASVRDADAGRGVIDVYEPIGVRVRQRLQQHALNHAEDRGIRADADRERHHRDRREQRQLHQAPNHMSHACRYAIDNRFVASPPVDRRVAPRLLSSRQTAPVRLSAGRQHTRLTNGGPHEKPSGSPCTWKRGRTPFSRDSTEKGTAPFRGAQVRRKRLHTRVRRDGHACVTAGLWLIAAGSYPRSASRSAREILATPLVLSPRQASRCSRRWWRLSNSSAAPRYRPSARADRGSPRRRATQLITRRCRSRRRCGAGSRCRRSNR